MKYLLVLILCVISFAKFPKFPSYSIYSNYEKTEEAYNPIDANTIYFWCADQGITLVSTKVSQWDDQIGTFDFLQATDANRPTFNSDSTALYFRPINSEFMATASSPTMDTSTFSFDFYVIIANKDTAQTILCEYQASTSYWQIATDATDAGNVIFGATKSSVNIHGYSVASSNYTAGKRTCFTVAILAGTSISWYFNNVSATVTTTTNLKQNFNNTGTLRLGKFNTTKYFRGYIWAIRISNKVRSQTEHTDFYNWCDQTF
jgi:hypothetical protein